MRLATAVARILAAIVSVVLATESGASLDTVQLSTSPALSAAFAPTIPDYVVRCTGTTPVQVTVSNSDAADTTTLVTVDSQPLTAGAFTTQVSLQKGQRFKITAVQGAASKDYSIRCLPDGYPTWGSQRPGSPQAEYYVVVPVPSTGVGIANRYIAIYDTNGVPIWWTRPPNPLRPVDAKLLPNRDILWTESETTSAIRGLKAEHRRLDGGVVDDSISPADYQLDAHEVQLLDDGNYLVIGTYGKCCYNLSSHGGPASATIRDSVIQEVTPGGSAVWTWLAADHIGLDEVQQQWWSSIVQGGTPYDVFHLNSAVTDAAGDVLISLRFANAVYKITRPGGPTNPGKVIWKLGGSAPTTEPGTRLTISGDPVFSSGGGFGGQHYPRYFNAGDGNLHVTLYDNASSLGRPPRGVRYRIDEAAMTATLVEDVRDTANPNLTSPCCGSAGKLSSGNWVMSWGQNPLVTELTPSGSRAFVLTFTAHSYRVDSVLPGALTREQLRGGMDVQYPRVVSNPVAVPDVGSLPQASAETAIVALGLSVGSVTVASSTTVPAGSVISQSPGPGALVPLGSAVTLVVSTGPAPGECAAGSTAPCDDGLFCNGVDVCSDGICIHAGDPCTSGSECADFCDEVGDHCADPEGTPCSVDGSVCTDDVCDGTGICGEPSTALCDDGDACTVADSCSAGICDPGTLITACTNGDGCCASGCDAGSDDDCSPAPVPMLGPPALFGLAAALAASACWWTRRRRDGAPG